MKTKFSTFVRTIGIHVFGIAVLLAVAIMPAEAQRRDRSWNQNRIDNTYRRDARRKLRSYQQMQRRDLHDRQKWERRAYGNDRYLKREQRLERRALNRRQVYEKKWYKSQYKRKPNKRYWY